MICDLRIWRLEYDVAEPGLSEAATSTCQASLPCAATMSSAIHYESPDEQADQGESIWPRQIAFFNGLGPRLIGFAHDHALAATSLAPSPKAAAAITRMLRAREARRHTDYARHAAWENSDLAGTHVYVGHVEPGALGRPVQY